MPTACPHTAALLPEMCITCQLKEKSWLFASKIAQQVKLYTCTPVLVHIQACTNYCCGSMHCHNSPANKVQSTCPVLFFIVLDVSVVVLASSTTKFLQRLVDVRVIGFPSELNNSISYVVVSENIYRDFNYQHFKRPDQQLVVSSQLPSQQPLICEGKTMEIHLCLGNYANMRT